MTATQGTCGRLWWVHAAVGGVAAFTLPVLLFMLAARESPQQAFFFGEDTGMGTKVLVTATLVLVAAVSLGYRHPRWASGTLGLLVVGFVGAMQLYELIFGAVFGVIVILTGLVVTVLAAVGVSVGLLARRLVTRRHRKTSALV